MKIIIFISLLNFIFISNSKSQDKDMIYYNADYIRMIILHPDSTRQIEPVGKKVRIAYESFFKNYRMDYIQADGIRVVLKLDYVKTGKDGRIYFTSNDNKKDLYYVFTDYLTSKNLLIFMKDEYTENGDMVYFSIEGIIQTPTYGEK